jgi:homoserine O-acetyltransferase/O-succinyltransferase
MKNIRTIDLFDFNLEKGKKQEHIALSYQTFGQPIGTAPVIVIHHSISGNSTVCGRNGWWNGLVGENKTIDTNSYTIIAFNIPGNGFGEDYETLIPNYRDFTIRDIASIFWEGLFYLKIKTVFSVIGGGLAGAIAWEMAALQPNRIENLIPIATDWKTTDRIISNVLIQDQLLNNSEDPMVDARYYANLYFKNSEYVNQLFRRTNLESSSIAAIEKCILTKNKCLISGYRLMNFIQKSNDLCRNRTDFTTVMGSIKATIHLIGIDTDGMYSVDENRITFLKLRKIKSNVFYHEIESDFGQDAYLKETETIANFLQPIFKSKQISIRNKFNYNFMNT